MSAQKQSANTLTTTTSRKEMAVKKINPTSIGQINFGKENDVGDYVMILIGGPDLHPEAITIHHPIGKTQLDGNEWVSTRTTDVHFLTSRARDPDGDLIGRKKEISSVELMVKNKLLFGDIKTPSYPVDKVAGDCNRNARLEESNKAMRNDKESKLEKHKLDQVGKPKAAKFAYGGVIQDFMASDMKAYEKFLKDETKKETFKKELETLMGPIQSYVTRGGPSGTEEQIPIPSLKKAKNPEEVAASLFGTVTKMVKGEVLTAPQPIPVLPVNSGNINTEALVKANAEVNRLNSQIVSLNAEKSIMQKSMKDYKDLYDHFNDWAKSANTNLESAIGKKKFPGDFTSSFWKDFPGSNPWNPNSGTSS